MQRNNDTVKRTVVQQNNLNFDNGFHSNDRIHDFFRSNSSMTWFSSAGKQQHQNSCSVQQQNSTAIQFSKQPHFSSV
jgi:hypothetical protein